MSCSLRLLGRSAARVLVIAALAAPASARDVGVQVAKDVAVKAALIYNFAKFAEWPAYAKAREWHIALQDHGDRVEFRNIKIKVL